MMGMIDDLTAKFDKKFDLLMEKLDRIDEKLDEINKEK